MSCSPVCLISRMSPLPPLLLPFLSFLSLSPTFTVTEAVVTVPFTKQEIENYWPLSSWNQEKALQLTVGDVITDVKLVCSSQ